MKNRIIVATVAAFALIVAGVAFAQEKEEGSAPQTAPMANIGPVKAIKIALGKVPGKVLQANFEFDEGHWVYGVMIVHNHKITEVEIDPMSGKIGDSEEVTPEGEAKEVLAELSKAVK